MIWAPRASGISRPAENSKVWCSGSTESIPSLTPNSKTRDSSDTMKVKLRWLSITPLGLPVVPEVKISEATVSGCTRAMQGLAALLLHLLVEEGEHLLEPPHPGGQAGLAQGPHQAGPLLAAGRRR